MRIIFAVLLLSFCVPNVFAADTEGHAVIGSAPTATTSSYATADQLQIDGSGTASTSAKPATSTPISATIIKVADDKKSIEVDEQNIVTSIKPESSIPISGQERFLFLGISAALLLGFSWIVLLLAEKKCFFCISSLVIGEDNRYSNSKFQIALWFFVVIATYLATILLRWKEAGGDYLLVNIPQNLLLLSGMSALSFVGAKAITTSKADPDKAREAADAVRDADAATKAAADSGATKGEKDAAVTATTNAKQKTTNVKYFNTGSEDFFKDLLQNDNGQIDFGDFQMLVVTILAVSVYLLEIYQFLGHVDLLKVVRLPDVDSTILSAFGLGHGAYLAKKYAGNPGES